MRNDSERYYEDLEMTASPLEVCLTLRDEWARHNVVKCLQIVLIRLPGSILIYGHLVLLTGAIIVGAFWGIFIALWDLSPVVALLVVGAFIGAAILQVILKARDSASQVEEGDADIAVPVRWATAHRVVRCPTCGKQFRLPAVPPLTFGCTGCATVMDLSAFRSP